MYFFWNDEDTYYALEEFLGVGDMMKSKIYYDEKEEHVDMCKALEDLYQSGIEAGIEQGMRNLIVVCCKLGQKKEDVIEVLQETSGLTVEETENVVDKYWGIL